MLKEIVKMVLDVVLPRNCLGCGKEGKYVCEKCELFLSEAPVLFQPGGLEEVAGAWEYEGLIKDIILKIKYKGMFDAINELVEKAFETRELYLPEDAVITFVPIFNKKERKRGFNQAEIIARKVGEITGKKVVSLLEKIKDTSSQTKLNKAERLENVKNSFTIMRKNESQNCRSHTSYSNVLLVDDVWTSGATMKECAKILKKSGVKNVFGFTLARTI